MDPNLDIAFVVIEPDYAARLLSTSHYNRRLTKRTVERYKADMIEGKWAVNPNTTGSIRRQSRHQAAIGIKAWNAFREGRTITLLRWSSGGKVPEAFPTMF